MKKFFKYSFLTLATLTLVVTVILSFNQIFQSNEGKSISHGSRFKGTLENGWLLPFSGENFSYFSHFSYYFMDNAYVNDKVYKAVIDSYKILEETAPNIEYHYMECSDEFGGNVIFHKSHKNGTSIDFMSPKMRENEVYTDLDDWGLLHYFLEFDNKGYLRPIYPFTDFIHPSVSNVIASQLDPKVSIDFETMAKHILALDDACKKNGISILQVILKTDLKDEFYATPSGKKVKARGIRLAMQLSEAVNGMHDEHYHIDFKL